jgi:hypothetical protein
MGINGALFAVDPDYAKHPMWSRLLGGFGTVTGGHKLLPLDSKSPFSMRRLDCALKGDKVVVLFPQGVGLGNPARSDMQGVQWLCARNPDMLIMDIVLDRYHVSLPWE